MRGELRERIDAQQEDIRGQAGTLIALDHRIAVQKDLVNWFAAEVAEKDKRGEHRATAADQRIDAVAEQLSGLALFEETQSALIADFRAVSESSTARIACNEQNIDATRRSVATLAEKLADELAVLRSALASGSTRTDATATAVDALAARVERHVEQMADAELTLRLGFQDQDQHLTELDQGLETVRDLIAEDIGAILRLSENAQVWEAQYRDLAHRLDGVPEQVGDAIAKAVEAHQEQTQAEQEECVRDRVVGYVDSIRPDLAGPIGPRGPAGMMGRAVHWVSGTLYPEGALVVRRGGIYQAKRPTDEEPGPDSRDWICITNGIEGVHVEADGWTLTHVVTDTIGTEHRCVYELPHPNPRKTWDPAVTYSYYDLVIWDGSSWLATQANPKGEPGKSSDWSLLAMRGPRGPKGERGDMGRMGPEGPMTPTAKVLDAWVEYLNQGNGTPLLSYRGVWTYATRYERGDLVQYREALHACVAGHDSEQVPGHIGQTNWVLVLDTSGGPSGPVGPAGPEGPAGPAGPTAVSTDAGNAATLGSDDLIYVPPVGSVTPVTTTASPTAADSGATYTNEGDADGAVIALPSAVAGLVFTAYVQAAQTFTVTAASGDTIRIAGSVTAAAGSVTSAVVGSALTLQAVNASEWVALSSTGSWSV